MQKFSDVNGSQAWLSHIIFWCKTQMFPVDSENKGIGVTIPILLEESVYLNVDFVFTYLT